MQEERYEAKWTDAGRQFQNPLSATENLDLVASFFQFQDFCNARFFFVHCSSSAYMFKRIQEKREMLDVSM